MQIIIDTREKMPWEYTNSIRQKLDTGDYSIADLTKEVCIERKKSVSEIAGNVVEDRFWREMERMSTFKHKIIVCEFPERDVLRFPTGANIPRFLKRKIRVKGPYISSCLERIVAEFNIEILFFNNAEEARTFSLAWLQDKYDVYSGR